MSQSDKAIDCVSYPMYHVNKVFCYLLPQFTLGIKAVENICVWNSGFQSLECPPDTFCFLSYYFNSSSNSLLIFLQFPSPYLAKKCFLLRLVLDREFKTSLSCVNAVSEGERL